MTAFQLIKLGLPNLTEEELTKIIELANYYKSPNSLDDKIKKLWLNGERLQAIKSYLYSDIHLIKPKLQDAKEYVEQLTNDSLSKY